MNTRAIAFLVMAATLGPEMTAQEPEGVEVRDVETLSGGQQADILLRAILAPRGLTSFATLQAYDRSTVCGQTPGGPKHPQSAMVRLPSYSKRVAHFAPTIQELFETHTIRRASGVRTGIQKGGGTSLQPSLYMARTEIANSTQPNQNVSQSSWHEVEYVHIHLYLPF